MKTILVDAVYTFCDKAGRIFAVHSAQSVGITSYHFDENTRDIARLKDFLDKASS